MRTIAVSIAALLLAALLIAGCGGQASSTAESGDGSGSGGIDLIPLHRYASVGRDTHRIVFPLEIKNYFLYNGWADPFRATPPGEEFASTGEQATISAHSRKAHLRFCVFEPGDRLLEFVAYSSGKYGGPAYNEVSISIGDTLLDRIEITETARRFSVELPEDLLQPGDNLITFEFSLLHKNEQWLTERKEHNQFPHPYICGYFADMVIVPGDGAFRLEARKRHSWEKLTYFEENGFLQQSADSSMGLVVPARRGASLSVSGQFQWGDGRVAETVTAVVHYRSEGELEYKKVWSEETVLDASNPAKSFASRIDFPSVAGDRLEIRLTIDSSAELPLASVIWKEIKFTADDVSPEEPPAAKEKLRADEQIQNVIFIVLDAARADAFGAYGSTDGATPHVDDFSNEAIVFENSLAPAPYTITSVSSLFSGLLPEAHGVRRVTQVFPSEIENLPRAFKRSGWFTLALAGTQFLEPHYGLSADFERVISLRREEDELQIRSTMDSAALLKGLKEAGQAHRDGKPVFLYIHLLPPHWPYRPPVEFDNIFTAGMGSPVLKRSWQLRDALQNDQIQPEGHDITLYKRMYLNNIYYADHLTGVILEELKQQQLFDNSLIIVTSDHGESFGEHDRFGHNLTTYEQMVHVPFIARIPGQKASRISQQMGWIDIFPTFAELFDLQLAPVEFQGRSLATHFTGRKSSSSDLYYSRAMGRDLNWCLRGETYKFLMQGPHQYLFNYKKDPEEKLNLLDTLPLLGMELRQRGLMLIDHNMAIASGEKEAELSEKDRENLRNLGYLQ